MNDKNLFVAGIPYGISSSAIEKCFATTGYQVKVKQEESISKGGSFQNLNLCQGYCVIQPRDQDTYFSILNYQGIIFQGRTLICKPYLEGDSLYRQNAYNNKRRVILKGIPIQISLDIIREFLEFVYGPVEKMYKFLSDRADSQRESPIYEPKFVSLSVMFWDKEAAKKASFDKSCQIHGFKIGIDAFQSKKKRRKGFIDIKLVATKAELASLRPFGSKEEVGSKPSFPWIPEEEQKVPESIQVQKKGKTLNTLDPQTIKMKQKQSKSTPCKPSRGDSGVQRYELLQRILLYSQHVKPTSKVYKILRSEFPDYSAMFELKDTWIARTNLKYHKESFH